MWEPQATTAAAASREGLKELISSTVMTSIAHQTMPGSSAMAHKVVNNITADMDEMNDTWNDVPPPPPPMSPPPSLMTPNDLMFRMKQQQQQQNGYTGSSSNREARSNNERDAANNESFCGLGDDTMSAMGAADLILTTPAPPRSMIGRDGGDSAKVPSSVPSRPPHTMEMGRLKVEETPAAAALERIKSAAFSADTNANRWGVNRLGLGDSEYNSGQNTLFSAGFGKSNGSCTMQQKQSILGGSSITDQSTWQKINAPFYAANNVTLSTVGAETNGSRGEGRHVHFFGGREVGRPASNLAADDDGNHQNIAAYDRYEGEIEKSIANQISLDQGSAHPVHKMEDSLERQKQIPPADMYNNTVDLSRRFDIVSANTRQHMPCDVPQNNTADFSLLEKGEHVDDKIENANEEDKISPVLVWLNSMGEYQQQISSGKEMLQGEQTQNFDGDGHLECSTIEPASSEIRNKAVGRNFLSSDNNVSNKISNGNSQYQQDFQQQQPFSQQIVKNIPTVKGWPCNIKEENAPFEQITQLLTKSNTIMTANDDTNDDIEGHNLPSESFSVDDNAICVGNDSMTVEEMIELGEQQMMNQSTESSTIIDNPQLSPSAEMRLGGVGERNRSSRLVGEEATGSQPPSLRKDTNSEETQVQTEKKPFLRKGSRKEPSAMHRKGTESKNNGSALKTSKQKLEELEKMQRDQLDQLEQRKKRIEAERQKQMKLKKTGNIRQRKTGIDNETKNHTETPTEEDKNINIPKKNKRTKPVVQQMTGNHPTDWNTNDSDKENIENYEESNLHAYSSDEDEQSLDERLHDSRKSMKEQRTNESVTPTKKKVDTQKTKSKSVSSRNSSEKRRRSPLKPSNRNENCKDEAGAERKRQYDEQWQMLKNMRKRQEVALREAERERETARAWAIAERESVQKWVKEQRASIQRDRHRANNAAMVSQRNKQQEQRDRRRAAAEKAHKREQEEINELRATVEKLKLDLNASKGRHKTNEKKLKERIREREEEIQNLRDRASAFEKTGSEELQEAEIDTDRKTEQTPTSKTKTPATKNSCLRDGSNLGQKRSTSGKKRTKSSKAKSPKVDSTGKVGGDNDQSPETHRESGNVRHSERRETEFQDKKCVELNDSHPLEIGPIEQNLSMPSALTEEPTEQWFQRQVTRLKNNKSNLALSEEKHQNSTNRQNRGEISNQRKRIERAKGLSFSDIFQFSDNQKPYDASNYGSSMRASEERIDNGAAEQDNTPLAQPVQMSGKAKSSGGSRTKEKLSDGRQVISYRNGTQKEVLLDGTTIIQFTNGDRKTTYANQCKETYFYAATQTTHTTHRDGLEIFEFPNEQVEHHYPSGKKEIMFPDGTKKIMFPDGFNETRFSDGVRLIEYPNGEKQVTRS